MAEVQRSQSSSSMILVVVGILCVLAGLIILQQRVGFSEVFLSSHHLFGVPLTSADSLKDLAVAVGSALLALQGIVLIGAGIVTSSRSSASPNPAASAQR